MIWNQNRLIAVKKLLTKATPPSMRRGMLEIRDRILDVNIHYRKIRGWIGKMPDFLIIGAQRCGTTYLYDEIIKHPNVAPALTKEVHFFDLNFPKGIGWYQAFFPCYLDESSLGINFITGEASPEYIFYPVAARRIFQTVPKVKIIALLRNPVSRAYSHYHHEVRLGFETLSFDEAIEKEEERLRGEREKMLADEIQDCYNYLHYSYLTRGVYFDQVSALRQVFPDDQILLLKSEDFYRNTATVMKQVFEFLELPDWEPEERGEPKVFPYPKMDEKTRQSLSDYFRPHNEKLFEYLGVDFGWNR